MRGQRDRGLTVRVYLCLIFPAAVEETKGFFWFTVLGDVLPQLKVLEAGV